MKKINTTDRVYRVLQIITVCILFIISLPVHVLAMLLILIDSGMPIFYVHKRVGKDNNTFKLIKLRTMEKDAEKYTGASLTNTEDRRTKVGKVLRVLKIDEIPQLINILKGEMNLVGPRPERPIIHNKLIDVIPGYHLRYKEKPGITGPAQLYTPYDTPKIERLKHDLDYISKKSILFDMKIIFATLAYIVNKALKFCIEESEVDDVSEDKIKIGSELKHGKVLLHHRDLSAMVTLKTVFREEGYVFFTVDDIGDVYDAVVSERPNLIVLDAFFDNNDHFHLCRELRDDKGTAHIPIVFFTNSRRKEDALIARELGIDIYIKKPATQDIVREAISC